MDFSTLQNGFDHWSAQLGLLTWPLFICSFLAALIVVERVLFLLIGQRDLKDRKALRTILRKDDIKGLFRLAHTPGDPSLRLGLRVLLAQIDDRERRETNAQIWINQYRRRLFAHLAWLSLIAVISPLLGLLGTVLGMIEAFTALSNHSGPISPAVLASGLQQAMTTTAAGLLIAVPALIAVHSLKIWAQARLTRMEDCLNQVHALLSSQANASSKTELDDDAPCEEGMTTAHSTAFADATPAPETTSVRATNAENQNRDSTKHQRDNTFTRMQSAGAGQ